MAFVLKEKKKNLSTCFFQQPDSLPVQKLFKPLDDSGEPHTLTRLLKTALPDYDWPGKNVKVCLSECMIMKERDIR